MTNNSLTSSDLILPQYESLPRWLLIPFVSISIIESILGVVGNILVMIVLIFFTASTTPQTSHHYFLMNLALSDFVLCLFTMPLNTYRSLYVYSTFPPTFCKLADCFPAINICVSSFTIMTISIYRYLLVCYPHRPALSKCSTLIIMISIWLLAIGASSPLFIYSRSIPAYEPSIVEAMLEVFCNYSLNNSCAQTYRKIYENLHVCHESWPLNGPFRLIYTIFMLFLQFILPILVICLTYYKVMLKLRERFRYRFLMKRNNISSLRHEISRQRRNNILLLLIVFLYAISWLPFNISYILFIYMNQSRTSANSYHPGSLKDLSTYLPFRFLICMISAISNPFLYSYFNETFKDGFEKIFNWCSPRLTRNLFHRLSLHHQNLPLQMKKHSHEQLSERTNRKMSSNDFNETKERTNQSQHSNH